MVSAVKPAVGQAAYSLGPALFALVGTTLFLRDGRHKLENSGITEEQAREALRVAHGGAPNPAAGSEVLDPEQARWVVSEATDSWLNAIHDLSLIMAVVLAAAIVVAMVLLRPTRGPTSRSKSGSKSGSKSRRERFLTWHANEHVAAPEPRFPRRPTCLLG